MLLSSTSLSVHAPLHGAWWSIIQYFIWTGKEVRQCGPGPLTPVLGVHACRECTMYFFKVGNFKRKERVLQQNRKESARKKPGAIFASSPVTPTQRDARTLSDLRDWSCRSEGGGQSSCSPFLSPVSLYAQRDKKAWRCLCAHSATVGWRRITSRNSWTPKQIKLKFHRQFVLW